MFKFSKGKAAFDAATVVIVVIIAVVAWNAGLLGGLKPQAQVQDGSGQPADTVIKVVGAPCTQATTLTSTPLRRYTDAALTSENITVYQNGVRKGAVASGSTTTVQSGANGDTLDLYFAEESTTYYTQHAKGKIETCTGSATTGDPAFKFVQDTSPGGTPITYSDVHKVMQIHNSQITMDLTNDGESETQGDVDDLAGGNLSIGTGGTASVSFAFKVDYNEGWGVIGGNILGCQFPSGVYDSSAPLSIEVAGKNLEAATKDVPSSVWPLYQANNSVKFYAMQGIDGRLTPTLKGSAIVRASTNNDPSGALDRINCTVFDTDYYVKDVDGSLVLDVVNRDDNTDLGGDNGLFDFVIGVE